LELGSGASKLSNVLLFEVLDTETSVKLLTEDLVLVHKVRQLLGELCVLVSQASNMTSQGIFLLEFFLLTVHELTVHLLGALIVVSGAEKLCLKALEFLLSLADVENKLSVTALETGELLSKFSALIRASVDTALEVVAVSQKLSI